MFIAIGLMLIYLLDPFSNLILLYILLQTGLGISSGLVARLLLIKHNRFLQLFIAIVAMFMGQGVFGIISEGELGLYISQLQAVHSMERMLLTIWCGFITSLFALAWNKKALLKTPQPCSDIQTKIKDARNPSMVDDSRQPEKKQKIYSQPKHEKNGLPAKNRLTNEKGKSVNVKGSTKVVGFPRRTNAEIRLKRTRRHTPILLDQKKGFHINQFRVPFSRSIKWVTSLKLKAGMVQRITKTKDWITSTIRLHGEENANHGRYVLSPNKAQAKPSTGGIRRKLNLVKLVGEEDHICPYCLEKVTRNDLRGLKKCSICKTWHHGDCWAEAGECQVPHYHK
jgi:hypothetical protein